MDVRPTPEQELLRRTIREFAEREIRPNIMAWDEAQHFPLELLPKLAAATEALRGGVARVQVRRIERARQGAASGHGRAEAGSFLVGEGDDHLGTAVRSFIANTS